MHPILKIIGHQQWLRYGIRDRIIRAFCDPSNNIDFEYEGKLSGFVYSGNLNNYIDWVKYFFGVYERPEVEIMKKIVEQIEKAVMLDVGCNTAHHSMYLANSCSIIHAFEPFKPLYDIAVGRLKKNQINNVYMHNLGLGSTNEFKSFFPPNNVNTGTGSFVPARNNSQHNKIDLQIVNGDEYLLPQLKSLDLVKIDVEGFESEVIKGMKHTLELHRPFVVMEYKQSNSKSETDISQLLELFPKDYEIYCIQDYINIFYFFTYKLFRLTKTIPSNKEINLLVYPKENIALLERSKLV